MLSQLFVRFLFLSSVCVATPKYVSSRLGLRIWGEICCALCNSNTLRAREISPFELNHIHKESFQEAIV
jgi:hypothetical protein